MSFEPAARARRFAAALDRDDHAGARRLLATGCVYALPGGARHGPDAFGRRCREASEWGRRVLGDLRFESEVAPAAGRVVEAAFSTTSPTVGCAAPIVRASGCDSTPRA